VGFCIPAQWTDDDWASWKETINRLMVVAGMDIFDQVTNWFHVVEHESCEQLKDQI